MLLHVEDLAHQRNGRSGGYGAHPMHGGGKTGEAAPGKHPKAVKKNQHRQHQQHAGQRRQTIPMCGDEKKHPGAEEDGAKDQRDQHLPSAAAGLGMGLFISADSGGGRVIEQTCGLPARQPRF